MSEFPPEMELHNPHVEPVCRKYLDLRYRLIPYLYTVDRVAHDSGLPIMQSLWLHYPEDLLSVQRRDEYLWGPALLVARVVEEGAKSRKLYLLRGTWYDFWADERISGRREITGQVNLETYPHSDQAGLNMPFGHVKHYMIEPERDAFQLIIFPGQDGKFSLYEDDGVGFNYGQGHYAQIESRRVTIYGVFESV